MNRYADVLLPLAFKQTLTYALPPALQGRVRVGSRVLVQLGPRKYYSAIVCRLHDVPPPPEVRVKDVSGLVDEESLLLPGQLRLWEWMAQYYMCASGEVMKAALPSGLKLESEMRLLRGQPPQDDAALTPREEAVLAALSEDEARSVADVQGRVGGGSVLPVVRRLVEAGLATVEERVVRQYRPRTVTHVRLAAPFRSEAALNALFPALHRAPKQETLLLRYLEMSHAAAAFALDHDGLLEEVPKADLLYGAEGGEAAFAALRKRGVLETYPFETERIKQATAQPRELEHPLTDEQERALREIDEVFATKDCCLLHGVTSSGKTEVYTQLIRREIEERGRQALYLLPEIALTTQIMQRLGRVFGGQMGVYHSKFPDAERVELWRRQLTERAFPLVLGVRSALFLPFRKLGLIIVDEEHETSYKQADPAPRYNARDTALVLARLTGAKVLLGTATPALETYRNARQGKYGLVEMFRRFGDRRLPEIVVENVKELRRKKLMPTPFAPRLLREMRDALVHREQVILFQNRRGYAPVLECRDCGWTPHCTRCDVPLTFHRKQNKLVCHYCGNLYDVPFACPQCGCTELRDLGYGTEKVEAAVRAAFPEARIGRLDLDTTRSRSSYDAIIGDFARGATDILIGTQMVTKGLDFERVRVVGILCADQLLNQPDFRAHERAFQLMAQVAGRAGRRGRRGLVVLQTRQPELPVVGQVVRNDYAALYRTQLAEREVFGFPPFVRLIGISLKHRDEHVCAAAAESFAALLRPHFRPDDLLGPDRPSVGRVQLQYIRRLLLKVRPALPVQGVRRTLQAAGAALQAVPAYKRVTLTFDVDPL